MKVQILTDHLYLVFINNFFLLLLSQHVDSKYKWSVTISTFIATFVLKRLWTCLQSKRKSAFKER